MVGEPSKDPRVQAERNSVVFPSTGKLYDRALRIFVPIRAATQDDPHDAKRFARTFYRNHWDWQLPALNEREPDATTRLPVDAVYRRYQILSWSLKFYFDYGYGRLSVPRRDSDTIDPSINSETHTEPLRVGGEIWQRIAADIAAGHLPPTAELLCDPANVPAPAAVHFEPMKLTYPFESKSTPVLRLALNAGKVAAVAQAGSQDEVGGAIRAQLKADHKLGARALDYSGSGRDPCWGVFNHSYEFVLATAGLATDLNHARCFGLFSLGTAGDIQHFDYGYSQRFL
jgi:hypothetical protein